MGPLCMIFEISCESIIILKQTIFKNLKEIKRITSNLTAFQSKVQHPLKENTKVQILNK